MDPADGTAILANPRYTGRQVWNRWRTDFDLFGPDNTALEHKQVQRWNLPEGQQDAVEVTAAFVSAISVETLVTPPHITERLGPLPK